MTPHVQGYLREFEASIPPQLQSLWSRTRTLSGLKTSLGNIGTLIPSLVFLDLMGFHPPKLAEVEIRTHLQAFAPFLRRSPEFFVEAQRIYFQELVSHIRSELIPIYTIASRHPEMSSRFPVTHPKPELAEAARLWTLSDRQELEFDGRPVNASTIGEWVASTEALPMPRPISPGIRGTLVRHSNSEMNEVFALEARPNTAAGTLSLAHCFVLEREAIIAVNGIEDVHPFAQWLNGYSPAPDRTVRLAEITATPTAAGDWAWMPAYHPLRLAILDEMKTSFRR